MEHEFQRLADLEAGQHAMVRKLEGGKSFVSRLAAMGFTPGASLTVVRKSGKGPVLINLRGAKVALGNFEARKVIISAIEQPENENVEVETVESPARSLVIALAGQPNVGKSTVFNFLTGLNQHVGNWAGKTVDLKSGGFTVGDTNITLVDLPGTYSLTASSEEERLARDFILEERPDLMIVVVDAANLERSLYLLAEILLLPVPVILALNMMDVAVQEGIQVEPGVLESALGIPVAPMSAAHNQGVEALEMAIHAFIDGRMKFNPKKPTISDEHKHILDEIQNRIAENVPKGYPPSWVAMKLLEGDEVLVSMMEKRLPPEQWQRVSNLLYEHEDAILDIAGERYEWIARMVRAAVVQPRLTRGSFTSRIDQALTHPVFGTLFLAIVLGAVFSVTYAIGSPLQSLLSEWIEAFAEWVRSSLSTMPAWLPHLLADGILGGVGLVLTFLPILAIFYTALGLLEDTGYMARIAYLTDRWMHRLGLHGKSFLPILLGFGCNVPAVFGTRIIESRRSRLLTILLIPLIPCTARMAVVTVLTPIFFPEHSALIAWGLVAGNILLLMILGLVLHSYILKNDHVAFIMELPLYHVPNIKTIGIYVWQNLIGFLEKAGTIILAGSLLVWGLSYFPTGDVLNSYLSYVGRLLEPLGRLMGLPWPVLMALLTSIVAKENTIATLGILYGDVVKNLPSIVSAPSALALLAFQMLFIPCLGTISAIRQETGSLKWTVVSSMIMLVLSVFFGVLIYQFGLIFLR
ncbi:MAG: ferrous iron transport protein B [Leptolinea sp.]|jgi:ferrous iron transport protein B|nr:ferrous iron transport protein B [Leptolinea sp.]